MYLSNTETVLLCVVCPTGSGKSSLMLSLFRLIDINVGSIVLDGVDTGSIALDSLRKQLAIIPQVSTWGRVVAMTSRGWYVPMYIHA